MHQIYLPILAVEWSFLPGDLCVVAIFAHHKFPISVLTASLLHCSDYPAPRFFLSPVVWNYGSVSTFGTWYVDMFNAFFKNSYFSIVI